MRHRSAAWRWRAVMARNTITPDCRSHEPSPLLPPHLPLALAAGASSNNQTPNRFAVIYHLLSTNLNHRLRIRVYCEDDEQPAVPSVVDIWPSANWFERETFDLYGIVFDEHPDLRRLLTDYGFVGHPLRKDFPVSGHVEMRYDPVEKRVVYQPVTIEPREIVPRVIREDSYGDV